MNRKNEQFRMDLFDWTRWITETPERLERITGKAGTSHVGRIDDTLPWTYENIKYIDHPNRSRTLGIKSLKQTKSNTDDTVIQVLTKQEWIEAVRADKAARLHK
ncbi:hypothetical protein AB3G45_19750 [Shinella sp. S4-D37]|uniref:hypothetical protein n=1 Tax=Shinella sp. S4-D37 TaxID=3161999 RepID=UPI003465A9F5